MRATGPGCDLDVEHPYLLDPTRVEDPGLVSFDSTGSLQPADAGDWNRERVRVTVDVLALNHRYLTEARRRHWMSCECKVNEARHLMAELQEQPSAAKRERLSGIIHTLRELVGEKAEFSKVASACIRSHGTAWMSHFG
jgi:hypothetical protein